MRVDHESIAPDINSLTGTNGEAACHFHALQVSIEAEPVSPLFQDTLYTVFITSESILLYDQDTKSLVVLDYKEIILHAILSGEATIYMQIESNSVAALYSGNDGSNDMDMVGIYLKPSDSLSIDEMFSAISKCASMHPDTTSPEGDGGVSINDFMNDTNHEWITADNIDSGRFDDAESEHINGHANGQEEEEEEEDGQRKWRRTT